MSHSLSPSKLPNTPKIAKAPTARYAISFTNDSKAIAIKRPSWRVLPAWVEVPNKIANRVIRIQKINAMEPLLVDDAKILAVSATALICNAIRGVTPMRITYVVMVPAQGDRYRKAIRSARELSWWLLVNSSIGFSNRGENKNASEIPIDCAR